MSIEGGSSKKRRRITINDVARASGVSCSTVSRVLSGYEFVRETTRSRVMQAVEQLGFVANLQAP
jgi:DNA-binding LacI/PurR family transcriptional regulator